MTSINAVASSSKRSASSQSTNPAKRLRLNRAESGEDDMSEEEQEVHENMDEATRAKIARKEARTIRNRESAQRSRNQRKAHLVYLEQRVSELEAENRALRAGETPPPRASPSSAERESSPAQSVISLANDLGIPPEIVSSSGGVSLANVAPPPADLDLDVKPVINPPSPVIVTQSLTFGDNTASSLESENASLRERIALLESLVKQVVALANLSGLPSSASPASALAPAPSAIENTLDWDTLVNSTSQGNLDATLSPPMYPVQPLESNTTQFNLTPSLPSVPAFPSNPEMNLACHPAVMATCTKSQALQRARKHSSLATLEMSSARLEMMAKVIVQLARVRGMSSHSPLKRVSTRSDRSRRLRAQRIPRRRLNGMRG